jgi:hypothetical protein
MTSEPLGTNTLEAEVIGVSLSGILVSLHDGRRNLYLPFAKFPCFENGTIRQIQNVQRPSDGHLYWPDLDIDLAVESIEHPERFPLMSKVGR